MQRYLLACAAALLLCACATTSASSQGAGAAPATTRTEATRAVVVPFMDAFCTQKQVREPFMQYVRPDYIQHNPVAADGRDNAITALEGFRASTPQSTCEIMRVIVDGDLAAVHQRIKITPESRGFAVVDIFRVQDGMIAEHWDVLQPVPEQSANPHPMF